MIGSFGDEVSWLKGINLLMLIRLIVSFLLLVLAGGNAQAQRIAGEFTGTITDPTGAAVADAKVTALETSTQRKWTAQSNEAGIYRLGSLPPGTAYQLTVEQTGFKTVKQDGLRLDVGDVQRVDITLEIGQLAETVTVSAEQAVLGLEKGEISNVVNQRSIVDLPLNGRNVYQLAELQPGVVRVAGSGLQESETTDAGVGASGTRYRDNQILLDGVTNNNDRQGGRTTLTLSPDAIEQFRIVTNNLSAEYGRSGGAMISVLTRAGTNDLHGSVFWFLRNDNLDASSTFEARSGSQPEFRRNHFGATLGGPIVKNRTFYFASYQGLRLSRPVTRQVTVETPQFRDFVLRTRPNSLAARLLRDFPPSANPTFNIQDIGSPAPGVRVSGPPDGIPDLGDVFIAVPGFTRDDQTSVRIDHSFSSRDTINGRFSVNDQTRQSAAGNSVRPFVADTLELDQNLGFNYTRIFSAQVVNDLRLGWNFDPQYTDGNFPEIPWIQMSVVGRSAALFGQTDGFVFPLDIRPQTYHLSDAVSIVWGRHSLKIGGEYRKFLENSEFPTNLKPAITFNDLLDFADDEVLTVQARVDPTTGRPAGTYRNFRQNEYGLFVQDDWKITPKLTLNIGLRYDNFGTLKEKNDKLSTLIYSSASLADARLPAVKELYASDNNNFAPRFGFAFDPSGSGKWAIRGGGGIFYSRVWSNFTGNSRFNTPFSIPVTLSALTPGQNPSSVYRIPFTGDPAFSRPLDEFGGSNALRPALQTIDTGLVTPYTAQWFLGLQRRFASDWVAEVNYTANIGRKLLLRNEINRFSGDRADGTVNRVHQSFGSIVHGTGGVNSSYHGMTAQLTKRFSRGYYAQVAYTFGKSIDTDSEPFGGGAGESQGTQEVNNRQLDRGLSAFDVTHRLAANFVWSLPLGFQVNGIVSMQSGFPFTVITSEDLNLDGVFTDRPNPVKALERRVGNSPSDFSNGAFGSADQWGSLFQPGAPGSVSMLGRNTFRGPGYASVDTSVLKTFKMPWFTPEGSAWELRAEFFNVLNRVNLRSPSNSLGTYNSATARWSNANFGRSLAAFDGRQIQFAIKFKF